MGASEPGPGPGRVRHWGTLNTVAILLLMGHLSLVRVRRWSLG